MPFNHSVPGWTKFFEVNCLWFKGKRDRLLQIYVDGVLAIKDLDECLEVGLGKVVYVDGEVP